MAFGIDDIVGAGLQIINKFIPDPAAQAQAAEQFRSQVLAASTSTDVAQAQTNTAEAGNANLYVSGWRPAIGWVCSLAMMFQYIVRPAVGVYASYNGHPPLALPGIDDNLWQLMFGMLGLGTLRTLEKVKGLTK